MIVMKFGGTSVESAAAIERVAGIVKAREARRPVVVVSAMGRTTNKLLALAGAAIEGKRHEYIGQLHDLRDFHSREARLVVPLAERAELDRALRTYLYYVGRNWLLVGKKNFHPIYYFYILTTELLLRFPYYIWQLTRTGRLRLVKYYLKGIKDGISGISGEAMITAIP